MEPYVTLLDQVVTCLTMTSLVTQVKDKGRPDVIESGRVVAYWDAHGE
jgi:hypothetical protein